MEKINYPKIVILHCSATPDYRPNDPGFDRFRIGDIDKWHRARGFAGCGYHYVITRAGNIELGRSEKVVGAHVEGHNQDSLGICYIGTRIILPLQIHSLQILQKIFENRYQIGVEKWFPHRFFNPNKSCPGFTRDRLIQILTLKDDK